MKIAKALTFAAFALVLGHPDPSWAVLAQPDEAFLEEKAKAIDTMADTHRAAAQTTLGAYQAMADFMAFRQKALQELDKKQPLTTFNGIETQDRLDDNILRVLYPLVSAGVRAETDAPLEDDAIYFATIMGDPPPLGDSPVGFMALEYANLAIKTVNILAGDQAISEAAAKKLALRLSHQAFTLYQDTHNDPLAVNYADTFRQSSVIVRLRDPEDGSTYRIMAQKNKIAEGGKAMYTVYQLRSNGNYKDLTLEFPLRYISRLHQVSEKQKLTKKPKPTSGSGP